MTSTPSASSHQYVCSPVLSERRIWVTRGRDWPRSRKMSTKRGMTKVSKNTTAPVPASVSRMG
jgi:hypothetical protein